VVLYKCQFESSQPVASAPKDHGVFMWPASCRGFCSPQGDNICTYMEETELECTARPCVTELGMETELGDRSLTAGVGAWLVAS
jgi:hypothetical protein